MATEAETLESTSVEKIEEAKELICSQVDKVLHKTTLEELQKVEDRHNLPPETVENSSKEEDDSVVAQDFKNASINPVSEGKIGITEDGSFLESPSLIKVASEDMSESSKDCEEKVKSVSTKTEPLDNESQMQKDQAEESFEATYGVPEGEKVGSCGEQVLAETGLENATVLIEGLAKYSEVSTEQVNIENSAGENLPPLGDTSVSTDLNLQEGKNEGAHDECMVKEKQNNEELCDSTQVPVENQQKTGIMDHKLVEISEAASDDNTLETTCASEDPDGECGINATLGQDQEDASSTPDLIKVSLKTDGGPIEETRKLGDHIYKMEEAYIKEEGTDKNLNIHVIPIKQEAKEFSFQEEELKDNEQENSSNLVGLVICPEVVIQKEEGANDKNLSVQDSLDVSMAITSPKVQHNEEKILKIDDNTSHKLHTSSTAIVTEETSSLQAEAEETVAPEPTSTVSSEDRSLEIVDSSKKINADNTVEGQVQDQNSNGITEKAEARDEEVTEQRSQKEDPDVEQLMEAVSKELETTVNAKAEREIFEKEEGQSQNLEKSIKEEREESETNRSDDNGQTETKNPEPDDSSAKSSTVVVEEQEQVSNKEPEGATQEEENIVEAFESESRGTTTIEQEKNTDGGATTGCIQTRDMEIQKVKEMGELDSEDKVENIGIKEIKEDHIAECKEVTDSYLGEGEDITIQEDGDVKNHNIASLGFETINSSQEDVEETDKVEEQILETVHEDQTYKTHDADDKTCRISSEEVNEEYETENADNYNGNRKTKKDGAIKVHSTIPREDEEEAKKPKGEVFEVLEIADADKDTGEQTAEETSVIEASITTIGEEEAVKESYQVDEVSEKQIKEDINVTDISTKSVGEETVETYSQEHKVPEQIQTFTADKDTAEQIVEVAAPSTVSVGESTIIAQEGEMDTTGHKGEAKESDLISMELRSEATDSTERKETVDLMDDDLYKSPNVYGFRETGGEEIVQKESSEKLGDSFTSASKVYEEEIKEAVLEQAESTTDEFGSASVTEISEITNLYKTEPECKKVIGVSEGLETAASSTHFENNTCEKEQALMSNLNERFKEETRGVETKLTDDIGEHGTQNEEVVAFTGLTSMEQNLSPVDSNDKTGSANVESESKHIDDLSFTHSLLEENIQGVSGEVCNVMSEEKIHKENGGSPEEEEHIAEALEVSRSPELTVSEQEKNLGDASISELIQSSEKVCLQVEETAESDSKEEIDSIADKEENTDKAPTSKPTLQKDEIKCEDIEHRNTEKGICMEDNNNILLRDETICQSSHADENEQKNINKWEPDMKDADQVLDAEDAVISGIQNEEICDRSKTMDVDEGTKNKKEVCIVKNICIGEETMKEGPEEDINEAKKPVKEVCEGLETTDTDDHIQKQITHEDGTVKEHFSTTVGEEKIEENSQKDEPLAIDQEPEVSEDLQVINVSKDSEDILQENYVVMDQSTIYLGEEAKQSCQEDKEEIPGKEVCPELEETSASKNIDEQITEEDDAVKAHHTTSTGKEILEESFQKDEENTKKLEREVFEEIDTEISGKDTERKIIQGLVVKEALVAPAESVVKESSLVEEVHEKLEASVEGESFKKQITQDVCATQLYSGSLGEETIKESSQEDEVKESDLESLEGAPDPTKEMDPITLKVEEDKNKSPNAFSPMDAPREEMTQKESIENLSHVSEASPVSEEQSKEIPEKKDDASTTHGIAPIVMVTEETNLSETEPESGMLVDASNLDHEEMIPAPTDKFMSSSQCLDVENLKFEGTSNIEENVADKILLKEKTGANDAKQGIYEIPEGASVVVQSVDQDTETSFGAKIMANKFSSDEKSQEPSMLVADNYDLESTTANEQIEDKSPMEDELRGEPVETPLMGQTKEEMNTQMEEPLKFEEDLEVGCQYIEEESSIPELDPEKLIPQSKDVMLEREAPIELTESKENSASETPEPGSQENKLEFHDHLDALPNENDTVRAYADIEKDTLQQEDPVQEVDQNFDESRKESVIIEDTIDETVSSTTISTENLAETPEVNDQGKKHETPPELMGDDYSHETLHDTEKTELDKAKETIKSQVSVSIEDQMDGKCFQEEGNQCKNPEEARPEMYGVIVDDSTTLSVGEETVGNLVEDKTEAKNSNGEACVGLQTTGTDNHIQKQIIQEDGTIKEHFSVTIGEEIIKKNSQKDEPLAIDHETEASEELEVISTSNNSEEIVQENDVVVDKSTLYLREEAAKQSSQEDEKEKPGKEVCPELEKTNANEDIDEQIAKEVDAVKAHHTMSTGEEILGERFQKDEEKTKKLAREVFEEIDTENSGKDTEMKIIGDLAVEEVLAAPAESVVQGSSPVEEVHGKIETSVEGESFEKQITQDVCATQLYTGSSGEETIKESSQEEEVKKSALGSLEGATDSTREMDPVTLKVEEDTSPNEFSPMDPPGEEMTKKESIENLSHMSQAPAVSEEQSKEIAEKEDYESNKHEVDSVAMATDETSSYETEPESRNLVYASSLDYEGMIPAPNNAVTTSLRSVAVEDVKLEETANVAETVTDEILLTEKSGANDANQEIYETPGEASDAVKSIDQDAETSSSAKITANEPSSNEKSEEKLEAPSMLVTDNYSLESIKAHEEIEDESLMKDELRGENMKTPFVGQTKEEMNTQSEEPLKFEEDSEIGSEHIQKESSSPELDSEVLSPESKDAILEREATMELTESTENSTSETPKPGSHKNKLEVHDHLDVVYNENHTVGAYANIEKDTIQQKDPVKEVDQNFDGSRTESMITQNTIVEVEAKDETHETESSNTTKAENLTEILEVIDLGEKLETPELRDHDHSHETLLETTNTELEKARETIENQVSVSIEDQMGGQCFQEDDDRGKNHEEAGQMHGAVVEELTTLSVGQETVGNLVEEKMEEKNPNNEVCEGLEITETNEHIQNQIIHEDGTVKEHFTITVGEQTIKEKSQIEEPLAIDHETEVYEEPEVIGTSKGSEEIVQENQVVLDHSTIYLREEAARQCSQDDEKEIPGKEVCPELEKTNASEDTDKQIPEELDSIKAHHSMSTRKEILGEGVQKDEEKTQQLEREAGLDTFSKEFEEIGTEISGKDTEMKIIEEHVKEALAAPAESLVEESSLVEELHGKLETGVEGESSEKQTTQDVLATQLYTGSVEEQTINESSHEDEVKESDLGSLEGATDSAKEMDPVTLKVDEDTSPNAFSPNDALEEMTEKESIENLSHMSQVSAASEEQSNEIPEKEDDERNTHEIDSIAMVTKETILYETEPESRGLVDASSLDYEGMIPAPTNAVTSDSQSSDVEHVKLEETANIKDKVINEILLTETSGANDAKQEIYEMQKGASDVVQSIDQDTETSIGAKIPANESSPDEKSEEKLQEPSMLVADNYALESMKENEKIADERPVKDEPRGENVETPLMGQSKEEMNTQMEEPLKFEEDSEIGAEHIEKEGSSPELDLEKLIPKSKDVISERETTIEQTESTENSTSETPEPGSQKNKLKVHDHLDAVSNENDTVGAHVNIEKDTSQQKDPVKEVDQNFDESRKESMTSENTIVAIEAKDESHETESSNTTNTENLAETLEVIDQGEKLETPSELMDHDHSHEALPEKIELEKAKETTKNQASVSIEDQMGKQCAQEEDDPRKNPEEARAKMYGAVADDITTLSVGQEMIGNLVEDTKEICGGLQTTCTDEHTEKRIINEDRAVKEHLSIVEELNNENTQKGETVECDAEGSDVLEVTSRSKDGEEHIIQENDVFIEHAKTFVKEEAVKQSSHEGEKEARELQKEVYLELETTCGGEDSEKQITEGNAVNCHHTMSIEQEKIAESFQEDEKQAKTLEREVLSGTDTTCASKDNEKQIIEDAVVTGSITKSIEEVVKESCQEKEVHERLETTSEGEAIERQLNEAFKESSRDTTSIAAVAEGVGLSETESKCENFVNEPNLASEEMVPAPTIAIMSSSEGQDVLAVKLEEISNFNENETKKIIFTEVSGANEAKQEIYEIQEEASVAIHELVYQDAETSTGEEITVSKSSSDDKSEEKLQETSMLVSNRNVFQSIKANETLMTMELGKNLDISLVAQSKEEMNMKMEEPRILEDDPEMGSPDIGKESLFPELDPERLMSESKDVTLEEKEEKASQLMDYDQIDKTLPETEKTELEKARAIIKDQDAVSVEDHYQRFQEEEKKGKKLQEARLEQDADSQYGNTNDADEPLNSITTDEKIPHGVQKNDESETTGKENIKGEPTAKDIEVSAVNEIIEEAKPTDAGTHVPSTRVTPTLHTKETHGLTVKDSALSNELLIEAGYCNENTGIESWAHFEDLIKKANGYSDIEEPLKKESSEILKEVSVSGSEVSKEISEENLGKSEDNVDRVCSTPATIATVGIDIKEKVLETYETTETKTKSDGVKNINSEITSNLVSELPTIQIGNEDEESQILDKLDSEDANIGNARAETGRHDLEKDEPVIKNSEKSYKQEEEACEKISLQNVADHQNSKEERVEAVNLRGKIEYAELENPEQKCDNLSNLTMTHTLAEEILVGHVGGGSGEASNLKWDKLERDIGSMPEAQIHEALVVENRTQYCESGSATESHDSLSVSEVTAGKRFQEDKEGYGNLMEEHNEEVGYDKNEKTNEANETSENIIVTEEVSTPRDNASTIEYIHTSEDEEAIKDSQKSIQESHREDERKGDKVMRVEPEKQIHELEAEVHRDNIYDIEEAPHNEISIQKVPEVLNNIDQVEGAAVECEPDISSQQLKSEKDKAGTLEREIVNGKVPEVLNNIEQVEGVAAECEPETPSQELTSEKHQGGKTNTTIEKEPVNAEVSTRLENAVARQNTEEQLKEDKESLKDLYLLSAAEETVESTHPEDKKDGKTVENEAPKLDIGYDAHEENCRDYATENEEIKSSKKVSAEPVTERADPTPTLGTTKIKDEEEKSHNVDAPHTRNAPSDAAPHEVAKELEEEYDFVPEAPIHETVHENAKDNEHATDGASTPKSFLEVKKPSGSTSIPVSKIEELQREEVYNDDSDASSLMEASQKEVQGKERKTTEVKETQESVIVKQTTTEVSVATEVREENIQDEASLEEKLHGSLDKLNEIIPESKYVNEEGKTKILEGKTLQETEILEETSDVTAEKQAHGEVGSIENTKTEISPSSTDAPLTPENLISNKAEVKNKKHGEPSVIEPELKDMESRGDTVMHESKKETMAELKPAETLSDLLQSSKKGHSVEERDVPANKEQLENKETPTTTVEQEKTDEEGEEEDEHKKADPDADALVMIEASKDIDVKPAHKKSHNILLGVGSKVKKSISKVKKAIIGKSSPQKQTSPK